MPAAANAMARGAGPNQCLGRQWRLNMEWRTRNVTLFSAGEYLALSDKSNVVSGRVGLRVAF